MGRAAVSNSASLDAPLQVNCLRTQTCCSSNRLLWQSAGDHLPWCRHKAKVCPLWCFGISPTSVLWPADVGELSALHTMGTLPQVWRSAEAWATFSSRSQSGVYVQRAACAGLSLHAAMLSCCHGLDRLIFRWFQVAQGCPEAMFRPGSLCSMPSVFVRQFPRWSLIV